MARLHEGLEGWRKWLICWTLVGLAGCHTLALGKITPGMTKAQVEERAGPPTEVRDLPGGETAWYYVKGPQGWTTDRVRFSPDGRVLGMEQVLSADNFNKRIRPLYTTRNELLQEFGRPAEIAEFPRMGEEVWKYRYLDASAEWINDVHIDADTGVVKRFNEYRDPAYMTGGTQ